MHWSMDQKKRILHSLDGYTCCFVGIAPDGTSTSKVIFNREDPCDLIIGYSKKYNTFAVWNPYLHAFRGATFKVRVGRFSTNTQRNTEGFLAIYSSLNDRKHSYEKKLLVKPDYIFEFCKSWREFLLPDVNDDQYNNKVLWADRYSPMPRSWEKISEKIETIERRRDTVSRARRGAQFRSKVLEAYGNRCAICRCQIPEILEAAHVYDVQYGGDDKINNGICLCANHHKLYDKGLINIKWEDKSLTINNPEVRSMDWYQRFMDEYEGHIIDVEE